MVPEHLRRPPKTSWPHTGSCNMIGGYRGGPQALSCSLPWGHFRARAVARLLAFCLLHPTVVAGPGSQLSHRHLPRGPEPRTQPDLQLTLRRPAWVTEPAQCACPGGVSPSGTGSCQEEAAQASHQLDQAAEDRQGERGRAAVGRREGGRRGERQLAASGKVCPGVRSRALHGAGDLPPTISSVSVVGERKLHSYWK